MAKAVNYTPEMETRMESVYTAATSDEGRKAAVMALASELGKTPASIRAKLSRMNVYRKAERTDKTGAPVVKKDAVATAIGEMLNLAEGDADSLAKANKGALKAILAAITPDESDEG